MMKINTLQTSLLVLLLAFGCHMSNENNFKKNTDNLKFIGLIPPIIADDTSKLFMEDYFTDLSSIDSVTSSSLALQLSPNKKELILNTNEQTPILSELKIWVRKQPISFLIKKSNKKLVNISFKLERKYTKVLIKGQFNNWLSEPMTLSTEGQLEKSFYLSPGNYQYKIILDDKEISDPSNPNIISNGMGGTNSLLIIPKTPNEQLPNLFTKQLSEGGLRIGFVNKPMEVFAFLQNKRIKTNIHNNNEIIIHLPKEASSQERTHLRIWAYNEAGISNDLLIPLENGQPISDTDKLKRSDLQYMLMYFALIDRFHNGKLNNDDPINDKRLRSIQNYMGGDLSGISKKIKEGYFDRLGINTLWLSPLTQNPYEAWQEFPEPRRWYSGYHGYWPISSSKVDHRLGTDEDLKELVKTAHEHEINIFLDYVCNHVHKNHPIYQKHPEWTTSFDLPDGSKNIRIWEKQRLTTWFDEFLPTLDLSNPEAIEAQTDSAIYWIKEYNLDGFRHDATKHIPEEFWRSLTRKLKQEVMIPQDRYIYQIGETYGSHELIAQYIGPGLLDAQFDFNLYFTSRDAFIKEDQSMEIVANALMESLSWYGHHHTMGNITGNHDQSRFMGLASGAVRYDENHVEAGFNRNIQVKDTKGYLTLSNYFAFVMTIPGVPTILYGDEIGMVGAGDPDNRRMMRFDSLSRFENRTRTIVSQLTQLRKNHLALSYGDFIMLHADKNVLAYARNYFGETVIVVINKGGREKISFYIPEYLNIDSLKNQFNTGNINIDNRKASISLPERSFEIFINQ